MTGNQVPTHVNQPGVDTWQTIRCRRITANLVLTIDRQSSGITTANRHMTANQVRHMTANQEPTHDSQPGSNTPQPTRCQHMTEHQVLTHNSQSGAYNWQPTRLDGLLKDIWYLDSVLDASLPSVRWLVRNAIVKNEGNHYVGAKHCQLGYIRPSRGIFASL